MRTTLEDNVVRNILIERGFNLKAVTWVPTSGQAIDANFAPVIFLNAAGAVNILMPTSTPARAGLTFFLQNISGTTVTLQTDGGAAFTTAIAIATLKGAVVTCTGSTTQALGWRAIAGA
jgi:hypothetical protein